MNRKKEFQINLDVDPKWPSHQARLYRRLLCEMIGVAIPRHIALRLWLVSGYSPKVEERCDPYSRHNILRDREVLLIPDADRVDKWVDKWMADASALAVIYQSVQVVDVRLPPFGLTGSDDISVLLT